MPLPAGKRMPAVPDPMTPPHTPAVSLHFPRVERLTYKPLQAAFAFILTAALLLPGVLMAGEEPAGNALQSTEFTLNSPSPGAPAEIRIKVHGVEHLDASLLSEPASEDSAEELKKQAQTAYLAAKFKEQEATIRKYVDLAWAEAGKRDWLAPELLIAIMQKESALRPKIQNRYGAQGLMQVVRRWHRDKLHPSESLFDPEVNIRVGADVLEEYLALADGNLNKALRKYSGNAKGYANTVLKESRALARVAEQAASKALVAQG